MGLARFLVIVTAMPLPTLLVGTLQAPAGGWLTLVGSYLFQTFSMLTPEPLGADPEIWTVELLWEQVMQTDATSSVAGQTRAGSVVALWRYPVKSMMGEELNSSEVTDRGLRGDRQFAIVDRPTGKVGGAKNPRKWGNFFDFRASYAEAPKLGGRISPIRITLPDGEMVGSDRADLEQILSRAFGRDI
jgi:MOSC N-terminal beta barrel domain